MGGKYEYVGAVDGDQENLNGTFGFGRSDGPFTGGDSAHIPTA